MQQRNGFGRNPPESLPKRPSGRFVYPINGDKLTVGRFCSIACGAKFMFAGDNHSMKSLSSYTFPVLFEEWGLDVKDITSAWDNKGDIVIGNDVRIGYRR